MSLICSFRSPPSPSFYCFWQLGLGPQVTAKGAETVPQQVMLPPPSQNGESTAGLPRRNSLTRVLKGNHVSMLSFMEGPLVTDTDRAGMGT